MLNGCITALVTPMNDSGSIDFHSLTNLLNEQIAAGVNGVVALGTTGEASALEHTEKLQIIRHICEVNKGRIKIIAGIGGATTAYSLQMIKEFGEIPGVDYLMCVTPYYVKPTQQGLYNYFALLATHTQKPLILYNVPCRTGCDLLNATLIQLIRDFPIICGLKDATGCLERCQDMLTTRESKFIYLSGDDETSSEFILLGGDGVISVSSNLIPVTMVSMINSALSKQAEKARAHKQKLTKLIAALFSESNPIPIKWALYKAAKIKSAHLRLPLTTLAEKHHCTLLKNMQEFSNG